MENLVIFNIEFMVIRIISNWIFVLALAYYLLTNLQWYSYKISRVILKHHKWEWHIIYFICPIIIFLCSNEIFYIYLYILYIPSLIYWAKHLDKPLVFTNRVERFIFIYIAFIVFGEVLYYGIENEAKGNSFYVLSIILAVIVSNLIEMVLIRQYAKVAKEKILSLDNMIIIVVTGSFGKTSLKNFLAQILSDKFQVYATPRSVNTFAGIVSDINNNLPQFTDIYIVEAGAREQGDILEIVELVMPHYGIIGKIGSAHIEYFKNQENVQKAKFELTKSKRLKFLYNYRDNNTPDVADGVFVIPFPSNIKNISATLDGTSFELLIAQEYYSFNTPILGAFNAENISAAIMIASSLNIEINRIQKVVHKLTPIPHRLNRVDANGKIILDDSFNGNIEGMLEAIRLASLYGGRKVIVTPGLIESSKEENEILAKAINDVFAIVILTGALNINVLSEYITKPQKIILKEKMAMESVLKASTCQGDLILFANDAPSYI